MNISFLTILPLGCLIVVGMALAIGWGIKRIGIRTNLDSSASTAENQVVSLSENTNTKVVRKYLPYLLSPLAQAILVYLVSAILIWLMPVVNQDFGSLLLYAVIFAFTGFSVLSPIINLFLPRWWLNTGLFLLSWYLLFSGLLGTMTLRFGDSADMTGLGMAFLLPMTAAIFVFPITALIQLFLFVMKRSQSKS